eukprot:4897104-Ditylum_brightwellii.AAC.1
MPPNNLYSDNNDKENHTYDLGKEYKFSDYLPTDLPQLHNLQKVLTSLFNSSWEAALISAPHK